VAESYNICSSRSRRPVRKLLDTPSYLFRISVILNGSLVFPCSVCSHIIRQHLVKLCLDLFSTKFIVSIYSVPSVVVLTRAHISSAFSIDPMRLYPLLYSLFYIYVYFHAPLFWQKTDPSSRHRGPSIATKTVIVLCETFKVCWGPDAKTDWLTDVTQL
jgi:hypothetical protein